MILAGLPGAGKSTLLNRLYHFRGDETEPVLAGAVRAIDSQQSRNRWARRLAPLPKPVRTTIVHATHVLRIARAVAAGHSVVAHNRGNWPHMLYGFAWLARLSGSQFHLIMIDVEPGIALAGQHTRGRVVSGATFARHVARWRRLLARARTGSLPPATSVTVLDRTAADRLQAIRFDAQRGRTGA